MQVKKIKKLFFIPSAYGMMVWIAILMLLAIRLIEVDVSGLAYALCAYIVLSFALSFVVVYNLYGSRIMTLNLSEIRLINIDWFLFFISFFVGAYGLFLYLHDFNSFLGGDSIFLVFFVDPLAIRSLAAEETSVGFQLSYFSWFAIGYAIYCLLIKYEGEKWFGWRLVLLIICIVLLVLNLFFIDRTRPILISLTTIFLIFASRFDRIKHPMRLMLISMAFPMVFFFVHALFTEKYDADEGLFKNFATYLLGGVGYLSVMLDVEFNGFEFKSTLLPLAKLAASLKFIDAPPSEVLEFRNVPFLTNVGTFVHPFLVDGGIFYAMVLIPITIFGLDLLAIHSIFSKSFTGLFLWASVVVIGLFSFFVPKFNATYFYIFIFLHGIVIANRLLNYTRKTT
jgi:hypothetical protein